MSDRLTVIPYDLSSEQREQQALEYRDIGFLSEGDGWGDGYGYGDGDGVSAAA